MVDREVTLRLNDQARGEIRRPMTVVPRVGVTSTLRLRSGPPATRRPRRFTVTLTHGARDTDGRHRHAGAAAGLAGRAAQPFRFTREDERETMTFELRPPPTPAPVAWTVAGRGPRRRRPRVRGRRGDRGLSPHPPPLVRHLVRRAVRVGAAGAAAARPHRLRPRRRRPGARGAAERRPARSRCSMPRRSRGGDLGRFAAIVVGTPGVRDRLRPGRGRTAACWPMSGAGGLSAGAVPAAALLRRADYAPLQADGGRARPCARRRRPWSTTG